MAAANIKNTDTILEIGPGIGTLTQALAQKAGKVVAIEKDHAMVEILGQTLAGFKNVEIIHGNILTLDPSPYTLAPYKLVANIPYYITSPIIRKFLEGENQPTTITLMVQREVAQRICAKPPEMSMLALSVQFYANPKIIATVPKGCFWPVPNVDSAILHITPFKKASMQGHKQGKALLVEEQTSPETFFAIAKAGFSAPRKQLAGNLAKGLKKEKAWVVEWLTHNGIDPQQRAETLSLRDWCSLVIHFY